MGTKEKKRSKKASQGRKKKRERDSRKKSAKKLCCDDDSMSLTSSSSYSSEENVKGRKSRSHAKKDVKRHMKRARSSDSSFDSMRVKMRRSSKRKVELVRKKKDGKKYKRAVSLSSTNSDESEYEKTRSESKKKGMHKRCNKEEECKRKKKRKRARSISLSTESSGSDNERKGKRYRSPSLSLLIMSSESERERKRKRYWSPSGSSLSRGSESSYQHGQEEIDVQIRPIRKLNSVIIVNGKSESDETYMSQGLKTDLQIRDDKRTIISSIVEKDENIEEKMCAAGSTALVLDSEDLESILRCKALENLKRFRGPKTSEESRSAERMEMSKTEVKRLPNSENAVDQEKIVSCGTEHSLSFENLPIQNEVAEDQVVDVNQVSFSGEKVLASPSANNNNVVETRTGSISVSQCADDNKIMTSKVDDQKPLTIADKKSKQNLIRHPAKSSNVNAKPNSLLIAQEPLAACSTKELNQKFLNVTHVPSKFSAEKGSDTQVDKVNLRSDDKLVKESNTVDATVPDNPSSSLPDIMAGENVSSQHQTENKEDSQFLDKTMSVMRGGELVQVNYKVYIPKKAPTANRRRLKR